LHCFTRHAEAAAKEIADRVAVELGSASMVARERVGKAEALDDVRVLHSVMAASLCGGRERSKARKGMVIDALEKIVGGE
jgi:hypothetical protein